MIGTIVNVIAVLVGGTIGLLLRKGIPTRISDGVMKALGLCTVYIGITGALKGKNTLVLILSMVIGTLIGELLDLDDKLNRLGRWLEEKCQKKNASTEEGPEGTKAVKRVSIAEGFVTASLLFCVGAMTIVGSLQAGLSGDCEMLFSKSMLDFTSSIIFGSTLGIGVLFSAVFVLAYQGGITLLAAWVAPLLTEAVVAEMTCAGSVIIIAIGLNLLGITKLKVMNFLPAIFLPTILCMWL